MLNSQNSSRTNVHAGVPQESILGPLLFLTYINDLSGNLTSNARLFPDDTSLFSVVHDVIVINLKEFVLLHEHFPQNIVHRTFSPPLARIC